jgi:hypothetical protein
VLDVGSIAEDGAPPDDPSHPPHPPPAHLGDLRSAAD